MPELILASTSKYRRELLERLRIPFRCLAPGVDEEVVQNRFAADDAEHLAEHLAEAKARAVAEIHPEAIVIGSDQVCVCEGTILHKPGTAERAREQLEYLSGRTHRLVTAVCIVHGGNVVSTKDVTQLTMRELAKDEIERYIAADQPLDCAGSYKLESLGISLFESIVSDDHTAITGLPLMLVGRQLRGFGLNVP
jgi:septum formation protein